MSEKSRKQQTWAIFSEAGITPIVFDPHDPVDAERGAKEIAQRISEAVDQICNDDKSKS